jgi:hypothetical protein
MQRLPPCRYGPSCYRKNPDHFREFSHPQGHVNCVVINSLPPCRYGPSCYRKNPDHFREFSHPHPQGQIVSSNSNVTGSLSLHGSNLTPRRPARNQDEQFRRDVISETIQVLGDGHSLEMKKSNAKQNLKVWSRGRRSGFKKVHIIHGDWGDVTLRFTREYGTTFAVLNMANGSRFGGGYVEGCAAQEENMFRRSDCHFADSGVNRSTQQYDHATSELINGQRGGVLLDMNPRVCVRAGDTERYRWYSDDEVFPFFELRSAAVDLRGGRPFDRRECQRRIQAQINTLIRFGVRHVVLSAFGCGAFENPATEVAQVYREVLEPNLDSFDVVVFAIYRAGYGPDNFTPFNSVLSSLP